MEKRTGAGGFGWGGARRPLARPGGRRAAFTLIEILLVIALIGLLSTVLVVGGSRMLDTEPTTPEEIFWEAMSQARRYALLHQTEVQLAFDQEKRAFLARTAEGAQSFSVPGEQEFQLDFLGAQRGGNTVLIGGQLVETRPLPWITFYGDGTCTPFRLQLRAGGGEPRIIPIDPWTCAPMLSREGATP